MDIRHLENKCAFQVEDPRRRFMEIPLPNPKINQKLSRKPSQNSVWQGGVRNWIGDQPGKLLVLSLFCFSFLLLYCRIWFSKWALQSTFYSILSPHEKTKQTKKYTLEKNISLHSTRVKRPINVRSWNQSLIHRRGKRQVNYEFASA